MDQDTFVKMDPATLRQVSSLDSETLDRAWRSVQSLKKQLPAMNAFARALTRTSDIKVVISDGPGSATDGKTIAIRPPIEMGDQLRHENRADCLPARDEYYVPICPACAVEESVLNTLIHEIAHKVYGTFQTVTAKDANEHLDRMTEEAKALGLQLGKTVFFDKNRTVDLQNYMAAAGQVNPFLAIILNAWEDAYVNRCTMEARPGTRAMFLHKTKTVFEKGIEFPEGWQHWDEAHPDMQAVIGLFCRASGYDTKGWFIDEVEDFLNSDDTAALLKSFTTARSAAARYRLAFPTLETLRKHGYCVRSGDEKKAGPADGPSRPQPQSPYMVQADPDEAGTCAAPAGSDDDEKPGDSQPDDQSSSEADGDAEADGSGQADGQKTEARDKAADKSIDGDKPDEAGDDTQAGEGPGAGDKGADSPDEAGDDAGQTTGHDPADDGQEADSGDTAAEGTEGTGDADDGQEADSGDTATEGTDGADDGQEADSGAQGGSDDQEADGGDGGDTEADGSGDGSGKDDGDEGTEGAGDADGSGEANGDGQDEADGVEANGSGAMGASGPQTRPDPSDPARVRRGLEVFGGHGPAGLNDDQPDANVEAAIKVALIQSNVFDAPSEHVQGVEVNRGWDLFDVAKGNGSECSPVPDGELAVGLLQMRVAFEDNAKARKQVNHKSGKVNARVLGRRVPTGDPRVFYKKREPGRRDYFVLIGIDVSGSTQDCVLVDGEAVQMIQVIKQAALAQAELCQRLGLKFAVYAHSGGRSPMLELRIWEVKGPDEPWTDRCRERLAKLRPIFANIDGHTMEFYRKVCDQVRATDKIILYYTDGLMPAHNPQEELVIMQREIKLCQQREYMMVGVSFDCDAPRDHGMDTIVVETDSGNTVQTVVKGLQDRLMKKLRGAA